MKFIFKNTYKKKEILKNAKTYANQKKYLLSARAYEIYLEKYGSDPSIHVQAGHMYKECLDFPKAKFHYEKAMVSLSKDPDFLLQMGHFYKVCGEYIKSGQYYSLSVEHGERSGDAQKELNSENNKKRIKSEIEYIKNQEKYFDRTLLKVDTKKLINYRSQELVVTKSGVDRRTVWGHGPTVSGIDSIRGYLLSSCEITKVDIRIQGKIFSIKNVNKFETEYFTKEGESIFKYVFHFWIDFSSFKKGWHDLYIIGNRRDFFSMENVSWKKESIIIDCDDRNELKNKISDKLNLGADIQDAINSLPSVCHVASNSRFKFKSDNILVIRIDQLGDMVSSLPALRTIKETFPNSNIIGLVSPSNEEFAKSIEIFNDVLTIDFHDDRNLHRRVLSESEQYNLQDILKKYNFDITFDISVSCQSSFKLVPLANAPVNIGAGSEHWETMGLSVFTHDLKTGAEIMPHSVRTQALAEVFKLWVNHKPFIFKRKDLNRGDLSNYGIADNENYIVLHTGSRIKFTRWPYFSNLSKEIVERKRIKTIVFCENYEDSKKFEDIDSDLLKVIHGNIDFKMFDTILSFASVFVGNDTGPKHLASLRGTPVISLHSQRTHWMEWGQENSGVIITRDVPCAGCHIHHYPEECGQEVACIKKIKVEEVYEQLKIFT